MKTIFITIVAMLFTYFARWVGDGEIDNSSIFVMVLILGLNILTKDEE
jgi:hypothetical protein